ncbi:uncharacterized protein LOC119725039 [Patiria miniata]|uniref:Sulfurtransferase n=1 Tax=Patiria miniata TaxID=46514 RepID=A0A913ZKL5_PATMI|nr:uncharacterized protein LOC119725039 [Patiria miniata]
MAMAAILSRAVLATTRCAGVRAASVAPQYNSPGCLRPPITSGITVYICSFLGSGSNDLTQQHQWIHRSLYTQYPTENPSLIPGSVASIRRSLSTDSSQLEDADNVYFDGLLKRVESGDMQMIDVRDASEIEEFGTIIKDICHIPVLDVEAALQLPDGEFRSKYGRGKPQKSDDNIVFTCKKGIRSLKARDTARSLGYSKARHYPGGWMEWGRKNNLPYPKE